MDCDEILSRAAGLRDDADPAVESHVAACADCREALDAAREGLVALAAFEGREAGRAAVPAKSDAVWLEARSRPWFRVLRLAARAAVVLLAATGALALAGVGVVSRSPQAAPGATAADIESAVSSALAKFDVRLAERDRARDAEFRDATEWLDGRRREDVEALVAEMSALRREIVAVRLNQRSLAEPAMPSLPDPR
jgi:hypothetical protein